MYDLTDLLIVKGLREKQGLRTYSCCIDIPMKVAVPTAKLTGYDADDWPSLHVALPQVAAGNQNESPYVLWRLFYTEKAFVFSFEFVITRWTSGGTQPAATYVMR